MLDGCHQMNGQGLYDDHFWSFLVTFTGKNPKFLRHTVGEQQLIRSLQQASCFHIM